MTVTLRKISEDDTPLLVEWRNASAKFFPPQPAWTAGSHLAWFRVTYVSDPSDNMFMVLLDGRPVGCLSMTIRDGHGELERMILGDKTIARGGVMRAAFRQLMNAYGLQHYWLRIYEWNTVTIAFHQRNGFEFAGRSDDGEYLIMERYHVPYEEGM